MPGAGLLYINAFVIRGEQPILVDTSAPMFREDYLNAAFSLVDPEDVRWIFLTHDDRDHSGNLIQVLERCPNARLITNFVAVGRVGEEWSLPMPRVQIANNGDRVHAGDRELVAIRPPYFDSPATRGLCGTPGRASTTAPTPLGPWCRRAAPAPRKYRPRPTGAGSTGSTASSIPGTP